MNEHARKLKSTKAMIGVDVGGTFTDLFFCDEATGDFSTGKVSSQRGSEERGFIEGLASLGPIAGYGSDRPWHDGRHQCVAGGARAHAPVS